MAQANRSTRSTNQGGEAARIGGGTRVRGRVTGEGSLTIDGSVEGSIQLTGDVVINDGGSATSDIEAHDVTVAGSLEGDIEASGAIHFGAGARVRGNVRGTGIVIEDGAKFAGRIDCEFDLPAELSGERTARR